MKLTSGIQGTSFRSQYPLSNQQLQAVAPSIFATRPYHDRSEKYAFTSTIDKIEALRQEGFFPFAVGQSKTRMQDKRGHAKHMVRLRRQDHIARPEADEVILVNDSSGQSSDVCYLGFVRFACMNGMICGTSVNEFRVPHRGRAADNVIEGVYSVLKSADVMHEQIEGMRATTLTQREQVAFASAAMQLRWDKDEAPVTPDGLLQRRRQEDTASDLFTVTNVLQEALVRGGTSGRTRTGRRHTTRAIASVTENIRLNRAIYELAEEMRKMKTA